MLSIGHASTAWAPSKFEDFVGQITLENDMQEEYYNHVTSNDK